MRRITQACSLALIAALAATAFSTGAMAHPGPHAHEGVMAGLAHPLTGLDHLLAMVAVGLWAAQLGGRALWTLPLAFPVAMAAGAALGFGGMALPWVEIGITASVLVLGAAVAAGYRPSLIVGLPLVAVFGLMHGYAHAVELPASTTALAYSVGFVAATFALHLVGIGLGLAMGRIQLRYGARTAGGAIAAAGAVLLLTP